jgi:hypothetical protein|tara:strand:- start:5959 stop:6150 length:192 start_codon:yes stop_codon:yes gene_type:complete
MIEVDFEIFDDLQSIRESGLCNMFDVTAVKELAKDETRNWINENKDMYMRGIAFGFSPIMDTV